MIGDSESVFSRRIHSKPLFNLIFVSRLLLLYKSVDVAHALYLHQ